MLRQLPKDLPLFGALLFGLSLVAFGYTAMRVELLIGRPSSTAGLGYIFIPIWGALAAIVGLVLGFVARAIWRRASGPVGPEKRTWALIVTLASAIIVSAGAGALDVVRYEQQAKPQIRFDSGLLIREFRPDPERTLRASTVLYDADHKPTALSWGSNRSELLFDGERVVLHDAVSGKNVAFNIPALDYVTRVDAVPMSVTHGHPLLAITISGRATGRRAVIAVIDGDYKVLFEEQVERFWELRDASIEIRIRPAATEEYVVIGPRCDKSLILRRKDAA
jgi:hypothetical protein